MGYGTQQFRFQFESEIPFAERKQLSAAILRQYPDKIPVIVEPYSATDPSVSHRKFLVPKDTDVNAIIEEINEQIKIHGPNVTLHTYIKLPHDLTPQSIGFLSDMYNLGTSYISTPLNLKALHSGFMVNDIYNRYKEEDGFLYLVYNVKISVIGSVTDSIMKYFNL